MSSPSAQELVQEARSWVGHPWRHQGRGVRGIDCVGLVVRVAHGFGLSEYDATGYSRRATGVGFEKHFDDNMNRVNIMDVREGDVVIFADTTYPCHCAFYSESKGYPTIIHAHAMRRKVLEEPFTDEWRNKALMAFRFRHLTNEESV